MLEDTKWKIRSGKSRTNRQYNDTKKKDEEANNDLQKTKDCETRTQPKPGRVSMSQPRWYLMNKQSSTY
jgi:hypothetical protein